MHTDWSLFFGRFHPLFVHLPIGIALFAALLSFIASYKKNAVVENAIDIALIAGGISAVLAAASGYFLSSNGGYDSDTLDLHKWVGIAATIVLLTTWLLRRTKKGNAQFLKVSIANWCLLLCIVLITIGGHLGGNMTHGEGYLTTHAPSFLKSWFGKETIAEEKKNLPPIDSVILFSTVIQPILQQKCVDCHNNNKTEGDLNLATTEGISKGGKNGSTIVAGDLDKSELYKRITLPTHSRKFMPADNRTPLSTIETALIRWWILSGADYKKNLTALAVDDKMKFLISSYLGINTEDNKEIILPTVPPADSAILSELKDQKLIIRNLTSGSNLLDVSFTMVQHADATQIEKLLERLALLKEQIYYLDISNSTLSIAAIKTISAFSKLNKLALQKNNLTDESIAPLKELKSLETLNLGQNSLSDKSIQIILEIKNLKKINLWQTQVTDEGIKSLQSQLAGTVIEH